MKIVGTLNNWDFDTNSYLSRLTMRPCNQNILRTLELVERMTAIADEGDKSREDVGCGVLYGVLRDSAYKIKKLAEEEQEAHRKKGWW